MVQLQPAAKHHTAAHSRSPPPWDGGKNRDGKSEKTRGLR